MMVMTVWVSSLLSICCPNSPKAN